MRGDERLSKIRDDLARRYGSSSDSSADTANFLRCLASSMKPALVRRTD